MSSEPDRKLRILHILRAPVGGLFRHVLDLTQGQIARGHAVGLVTDSTTGGARAEAIFAELAPQLELGLTRVPMTRNPGLADIAALRHVSERIRSTQADVAHGHGSKGGVYARASRWFDGTQAVRAYTPHGGSFNYRPGSAAHRIYMAIESALNGATDLYLFESAYIQSRFYAHVGAARHAERIVLNGISPAELEPVEPETGAADFVYVGELRSAKGIDVLIAALARISAGRAVAPRLVLVGAGPDEAELTAQAGALGVGAQVAFAGAMPARRAFALGRVLIVPSRAESLPYVVLEAAGARMPMISTDAGGIPEIFGPYADRLIHAGDVAALAERMQAALVERESALREAADVAAFVAGRFTLEAMVEGVLEGYRDALAARAGISSAAATQTMPAGAVAPHGATR